MRFVVQVQVRRGTSREPIASRYIAADGAHGSEAIAKARDQMAREGEPSPGERLSYIARRCPLGVVNPF